MAEDPRLNEWRGSEYELVRQRRDRRRWPGSALLASASSSPLLPHAPTVLLLPATLQPRKANFANFQCLLVIQMLVKLLEL